MRISVAFLIFCAHLALAQKAEIAFTIKEKDLIPEGIAYDPVGKDFYVGSIQKQKIIRIRQSGAVSDFATSASSSLLQVLGMKVRDGLLWACNNSSELDSTRIANVSVINLKTGKLEKKYSLNDGKRHLFNDLVFHADGSVFITDSHAGSVYRILPGSSDVEEFAKIRADAYPNGITCSPDEKKLLVSTGTEMGIVSIDLATRSITPITHERFFIIGADGLYRHKNFLVAVQNVTYPEAVLRYNVAPDFSSIQSITTLVSDHPLFDSPTTGVIAGTYFYFIANSQLSQIEGGRSPIKKPDALKDIVIMRIALE